MAGPVFGMAGLVQIDSDPNNYYDLKWDNSSDHIDI